MFEHPEIVLNSNKPWTLVGTITLVAVLTPDQPTEGVASKPNQDSDPGCKAP